MTDNEVAVALSPLVAVTSGWTDEAYDIYERQLLVLTDVVTLGKAVNFLVATWAKPGRPPVAMILEAYRNHLPEQPALGPRAAPVCPAERGLLIARAAYEDECRLHGREPNYTFFDATIARAVSRDVIQPDPPRRA